MVKKVIFLIFLFVFAQTTLAVQGEGEIFHIGKGKVIKKMTVDETIISEVEEAIETISGVFPGFEPIPKEGHMIKIPLERPIEVKNEWLVDLIDEVIVIIPKDEAPYLLIFDNEVNPYFFTIHHPLEKIIANIK